MSAHHLVGGTGPGRRWRTVALNEALVLRLAAEFPPTAGTAVDLSSKDRHGLEPATADDGVTLSFLSELSRPVLPSSGRRIVQVRAVSDVPRLAEPAPELLV